MPAGRRLAVLMLVLVLGLASCGGPTDREGSSGEGGQAGFPVSIDHEFGQTTIEAKPETVVALGVTDIDPLLALDTVPVAAAAYTQYSKSIVGPWAKELLSGQTVELIENESKPDIERIAALEPDLIVAISSGIDAETYALLDKVAPTLARPADVAAYTVPRDRATTMIATALGQEQKGQQLVDDANAAIVAAAKDHPEFTGSTGAVVLPYEDKYGVYTSGDARGQFLTQLGFDLPPDVSAQDDGTSFFIDLSREEADRMEGDVLVVLTDPSTRKATESDPLLRQLDVAKRGAMIIADADTRGALTYNSVLSVPFALEQLVPQLSKAVEA